VKKVLVAAGAIILFAFVLFCAYFGFKKFVNGNARQTSGAESSADTGTLAAVEDGGKWGFIGRTGNYAIKPQFDYASPFFEGLALVKQKMKYGFIDRSGEYVIQPQFDFALLFSDGLALVVQDKKYGYIDKTGKFIVKPQFDEGLPFVGGTASSGRRQVGLYR